MTVSLVNSRNVYVWGMGLKTRRAKMNKREKAALKDCIEDFEDTTTKIHQSLVELKHFRVNTFKAQGLVEQRGNVDELSPHQR